MYELELQRRLADGASGIPTLFVIGRPDEEMRARALPGGERPISSPNDLPTTRC
jgi:hypothetical protein